jgi:hypothetical protein
MRKLSKLYTVIIPIAGIIFAIVFVYISFHFFISIVFQEHFSTGTSRTPSETTGQTTATKISSAETTTLVTTPETAIDEQQAVQIAKSRFEQYLRERPEMKVENPEYTVTKKIYHAYEYWSVTVKLKEPEYSYYYYEIQISLDGEKVTLATG